MVALQTAVDQTSSSRKTDARRDYILAIVLDAASFVGQHYVTRYGTALQQHHP